MCAAGRRKAAEAERQKKAKAISNWILGDLTRLLNLENMKIEDAKVEPEANLVELLDLMEKGHFQRPSGQKAFEVTFKTVKASEVIK